MKIFISVLLILCVFATSFGQIYSVYNIGYNLSDSVYKPYDDESEVWENPDNFENSDETTYYQYWPADNDFPENMSVPSEWLKPTIFKNTCFYDNNNKLQKKEVYFFGIGLDDYKLHREYYYEYNDDGKLTYRKIFSFFDNDDPNIITREAIRKNEYNENGNLLSEILEFNYPDELSEYDTIKYEYSYDENNDLIIQKQLILNRSFPDNIYFTFVDDTLYNNISQDVADSIANIYHTHSEFVDSLEYITKIKISDNKDSITATSFVLETNSAETKYNLYAQTIHSYYDNNDGTIFITDVRRDADTSGTLYPIPTYYKQRTYKDGKLIHSIIEDMHGPSIHTSCNSDGCNTTVGMSIDKNEIIYYYDENGILESSELIITSSYPTQVLPDVRYFYKILPDSISTKDAPSSLNKTKSNSLSIYPNPANDVVNIEMQQTIDRGKILITNISGKLIEQLPINRQSKISINVSQYEKGIYFISLEGRFENYIEKIVIY